VSEATTPDIRGYAKFQRMEQELATSVIGACDTGFEMRDGTLATSRRAIIGTWQIKDATEEGETLFNRAVRWAGRLENVEEIIP